MAVSLASQQTVSNTTPESLTITKPTSLAAGDLLIAGVSASTGGASSKSFDTPAGWTELQQVSEDSNNTMLAVFAKIADGSDAVASNFTFTASGTTSEMSNGIGILSRVTSDNGFGTVANHLGSASGTASGTSFSAGGVTTNYSSELLLMFAASERVDGDQNFSSYAVANSDPTWTEEEDIYQETGGIAINMAFASSTYASAGDTGNFSFSVSTSESLSGVLVSVTENQNVDVTPTPLTVSPTLRTVSPGAGVSFSTTPLTITPIFNGLTAEAVNRNVWANPSKPTTVWNNLDKS